MWALVGYWLQKEVVFLHECSHATREATQLYVERWQRLAHETSEPRDLDYFLRRRCLQFTYLKKPQTLKALMETFPERLLAQQLFFKALERVDVDGCRLLLPYLNLSGKKIQEVRRILVDQIILLSGTGSHGSRDIVTVQTTRMIFEYGNWQNSLLRQVAEDYPWTDRTWLRGVRHCVPRWETMDLCHTLLKKILCFEPNARER